jgi:SAM domain (Sterile alpha motif)
MVRDVRNWLEELGLGKYVERFLANDVDFNVLHDLNESDLERLGLSLGHRKKLLRAVADLETVRPAESGNPRETDVQPFSRHVGI